MAEKSYSIGIDVNNVKSVNISRYADGYNYASVSCKMADNEYMSVHYEWKGKQIPEFAMQTMEIMKALSTEKASELEVEADSVEYLERAARIIKELAAKMKKKDVPVEDEEDMEDEDEKMKKSKKKKD